MVGIIFISLFDALIHETKNRFNKGLVWLSFGFVHVFDVIKQRNQTFYGLNSNDLVGILKILNEEREECRIEWLQAISWVVEYKWQQ